VVLGDGGKSERFDIWSPGTAFVPTWKSGISYLVGMDDAGAVGVVTDAKAGPCLVRLIPQPTGLVETGRRCGLTSGTQTVQAAVDGQIAVAQGAMVTVIDPANDFTDGLPRASCDLGSEVRNVIWTDPVHVLAMTTAGPRFCDPASGAVQVLPAPPASPTGQPWVPVRSYGNR
jgi:hypothetical protein